MRVEGSLFPACYLQGAVQPQRVARIRDSKSGQTIPKVLALRPRRIGRDRRYLGRAKTATCRCIKSSRSPIHCFRLFLSMEKATGACEAAADAQDRKIGPLMAKRRKPVPPPAIT